MNPQHRLKRLRWTRSWGSYDFSDVIFSDEKKWCCVRKGQQFVGKGQQFRYHTKYTVPTRQAGGGSVMHGLGGHLPDQDIPPRAG